MMKNETQPENGELEYLKQRLADLEKRMTSIEEDATGFHRVGRFRVQQSQRDEPEQIKDTSQEDSIESRIGEYGMAWLGNIVLLFGILFLTQYLQKNNQEFISLIFGFASVALVYLIGHYTRKSLPYMSRLFNYNGHLLFTQARQPTQTSPSMNTIRWLKLTMPLEPIISERMPCSSSLSVTLTS